VDGRPPTQELLDERHAFGELAGRKTRRAQIARAAVTDADTEHRAAGREQLDRRDRGRRDGWMARDEVGHADGNPGAPRAFGQERRRHPGVHGDTRRVGDPDHVVPGVDASAIAHRAT
jgi:hypothetical protein